MAKAAATAKAPTKTEIVAQMAEEAGITKKQAAAALTALQNMAGKALKKGGVFVIPGFVKAKVVVKPATKARKGINPFTKEEIMIKAKPARKVVKVQALKSLKDMV
ncbi:MAG: HU family DNA-binding protein [Burkholderiales bacterium]|jgi:nucleoid DNA-binding protein|nr:HU family DNA-binding protein [Burkholderiales bacterium]